jgi:hypothetical protein
VTTQVSDRSGGALGECEADPPGPSERLSKIRRMERSRILPVVKAYPVADHVSFSEAVCVAGISINEPRQWVRLFPLDFRGLDRVQQFRKYEVIELDTVPSKADTRPESRTPILDSITVCEHLDSDSGTWRRRLPFFDAIEDESMCAIQRRQQTHRQSLGVFSPADVADLIVNPAPPEFAESQRAVIDQGSLLGDRAGDRRRAKLEPMPVKAKFKYRCAEVSCRGHNQSLIDWELGQLFRSLRQKGDDEETCRRKVREKFLGYCSPEYDVRFITGSMLSKPKSFLVLGLVHPKRGPETLF